MERMYNGKVAMFYGLDVAYSNDKLVRLDAVAAKCDRTAVRCSRVYLDTIRDSLESSEFLNKLYDNHGGMAISKKEFFDKCELIAVDETMYILQQRRTQLLEENTENKANTGNSTLMPTVRMYSDKISIFHDESFIETIRELVKSSIK